MSRRVRASVLALGGALAFAFGGLARADTIVVPTDVSTIGGAIQLAEAGDEVLILPGTYAEWDVSMKGGITIRSQSGSSATCVDGNRAAPVFVCQDQPLPVIVEGLTIRNGFASGAGVLGQGGGIRILGSTVTMQSCVIEDCEAGYGGGVAVLDGDLSLLETTIRNNTAGGSNGGIGAGRSQLSIIDCEIIGNVAGAGVAGGVGGNRVSLVIRGSLVARNWAIVYGSGSAIYLETSSGAIENSTIAENIAWLDEAALNFEAGCVISVTGVVVASNVGTAVYCFDSQVDTSCSDFHGNTAGNLLCGTDAGGNFSADPLFCDLEADDYTLDADSPCLPGQHPDGVDCGLIGALGQGCGGTTPIESSSWGRIKALYRR